MVRRTLVGLSALALVFSVGTVSADDDPRLPIYEPAFLEPVPAGPCVKDNSYDIDNSAVYGAICERLRFVFGPILAKPGQNDVLIQPTTFEKPAYDGYFVRFKPDLIDALGVVPPVDELHLHHGTWLNAGIRSYGSGPFFASGEEKTIGIFPPGYGVLVQATDTWLMLHMVHNATPVPRVVYLTYDLDFIKRSDAEAINPLTGKQWVTNTRQIWLDVGGGKFHRETDTYTANPVFNIQKGFGQLDPGSFGGTFGALDTIRHNGSVCAWPKQNCARFNSEGVPSVQQGKIFDSQGNPVIVPGKDVLVTKEVLGGQTQGTLIVIGGHVHPGGIRDEVSLVRGTPENPLVRDEATGTWVGGVSKPIHISDAIYWQYDNPATPLDEGTLAGGPPTSWDFSMTGTSDSLGWKVRVKENDLLRLNGVYDTQIGSWYEQMGIVMTWVVPGDTSGVDPFDPNVILDPGYPTTAEDNLPPGISATCTPGPTTDGKTRLCLRGSVTHGHIESSGDHASCETTTCRPLPNVDGPMVTDIAIEAFTYGQADLGMVGLTGIPRMRVGQKVTFWNYDAAAYIWHTVTRCLEPCTGPTSTNYPLADGGSGNPLDTMDFDSSELGVGLAPAQRIEWEFTPDQAGDYTFFCRIHPQMRGVIRVIPA